MPSHNTKLKKLERELWDLVRARAPASQETLEHAKKLRAWSDETPRVVRRAQELVATGKNDEAALLLEQHHGARPRRRPGRPSKALPPPARVVRLLREEIFALGLEFVLSDERKARRVIESAAQAAFDHSTT
jgi:hypothetical protein